MAKQKQEEAPKGSPAWMATFSDLMNLLLCFFVLLFSMANVEEEKFQEVVASLNNSFSILSSGGTSIGEGTLISSGISCLDMFNDYYQSVTDGKDPELELQGGDGTNDDNGESSSELGDGTKTDPGQTQEGDGQQGLSPSGERNQGLTTEELIEQLQEAGISESEKMAEELEKQLDNEGLAQYVDVDFNEQYVLITLNGAILFDSGSATLKEDALPLITKLSKLIGTYDSNIIEVEGHTDNVPMSSNKKYENNDVLSMYRALNVADLIRVNSGVNPANIKSSGRGQYMPIADNTTADGRARNRRVEIKIYNSINSEGAIGY